MTNQPRTETLPSAQLIKKGQLSINPINNKPFTGITIEHYHNNNNPFDISKIKTRTAFTQGKKDGLEEYFFKSGKLKYRGNYKNGKKHGLWERFHESGQLEFFIENFKDGELVGFSGTIYEKDLDDDIPF